MNNFNLKKFLIENKLTRNSKGLVDEQMDIYDDIANSEFGMDYEQLGSNEQEWVRDEIDNLPENEENGPFFKATVNFPSKPGIDYGFTVYAKDEEGAKIALADKIENLMPGEEYSIKKLNGPSTEQPEKEEIASRVDMSTIELDGVDPSDYPDFVDTFVASAQFKDGTDLSDDELDQLTDELYQDGQMSDLAYQSLLEGKTEKEQKLIKEVLKTIKKS